MQRLLTLAIAGTLTLAAGSAIAQEPGTVVAKDRRVQGRSYVFPTTGVSVPYAQFVPSTYDATRPSPVIVALHGLGRPADRADVR